MSRVGSEVLGASVGLLSLALVSATLASFLGATDVEPGPWMFRASALGTAALVYAYRGLANVWILVVAAASLIVGEIGLTTDDLSAVCLCVGALLVVQLGIHARRFEHGRAIRLAAQRLADAAPNSPPDRRVPTIAADTLGEELRARAETVPIEELAGRGHVSLTPVDPAALERIVSDRVALALERGGIHTSPGLRRQLERDAQRGFFELLDDHQRAKAETGEEGRRRRELEATVRKSRAQIESTFAELEKLRSRAGITLDKDAVDGLSERLAGCVHELVSNERSQPMTEAATATLAQLEIGLLEIVSRVAARGRSDHERVLEQRIATLNEALARTETVLRDVAKERHDDDGLPSIYRSVQGLAPDAAHRARKEELLAIVFRENVALKERLRSRTDPTPTR